MTDLERLEQAGLEWCACPLTCPFYATRARGHCGYRNRQDQKD